MSSEPLDLEAIKARTEAATPGPWVRAKWNPRTIITEPWAKFDDYEGDTPNEPLYPMYATKDADGEFITHARTDVPALIALVERLRGENTELRADLDAAVARAEQAEAKLAALVPVPIRPAYEAYASEQALSGEHTADGWVPTHATWDLPLDLVPPVTTPRDPFREYPDVDRGLFVLRGLSE